MSVLTVDILNHLMIQQMTPIFDEVTVVDHGMGQQLLRRHLCHGSFDDYSQDETVREGDAVADGGIGQCRQDNDR